MEPVFFADDDIMLNAILRLKCCVFISPPGEYASDNSAGAGYDPESYDLGEEVLVNPWTTDNLTIPPAPPLNSDSVDTSVSQLQDLLATKPQVITARGEQHVAAKNLSFE